MAYNTTQLVTEAFYLSGIVSRDFQTPTGDQITAGIFQLNNLLGDKTIQNGLIPYYSEYNLNMVIGQEEYFIPNLINIDTFVFYLASIRYATREVARHAFQGSARADNINSLMYEWHFERCFGGGKLFVYFFPDQGYPCTIWGQFRLSSTTAFQDLSTIYDIFYIDFLTFELAARLCNVYSYSIPPGVEKQLQSFYETIDNTSSTFDLRTQKISTLQPGGYINYAQVNIGQGYTTPG